MEEIEDNECMNCYREMDNYFEPFCCDECYDEWHLDNEDYYWSEEQQMYLEYEQDIKQDSLGYIH